MAQRYFVATPLSILLFTGIAVAQYGSAPDNQPSTADQVKKVRASGCVEAGVEASCLVLKNTKGDQMYTLFFPSGRKPELGTAISFTGTQHNGVSTCMQGTAVDVDKWKTFKMTCPKPENQTEKK